MSDAVKAALLERCRQMEIPLVGVADARRWETPLFEPWIPEPFFPQAIFPETRSVIVIGLPVILPALETAPSIWYHDLYLTINALLDQYAYRLAAFLNGMGYPSVCVPRDGYGGIEVLLDNPVAFFSHRHAAFLAGLGSFGVNNMLLTPKYGPRVRFSSVLTAAGLPPDPLMADPLCTRCMLCVDACPAGALDAGDYPDSLTDKRACSGQSARLLEQQIAPCGICIKVCPIGADRAHFGREPADLYRDPGMRPELHRAWDHVRSYGSRKKRMTR
ncbi:MAG: epoxyqueuosine reductase [Methanomicrobiales archaeon]|nr:epoxyqueuosine reductase [Methanomicrobiales archaeon]